MKPPYVITPEILHLVTSISEKIGQINAKYLDKPTPKLRKKNKIKTIHSSLGIEGNSLTEAQVTALLENKRVLGPEKDILEVRNALEVYGAINKFNPYNLKSFLSAHKMLMQNLVIDNGKFRTKGVGVMAGKKIAHMAPPANRVPGLMNELFNYLKSSSEIVLIKSCVFHYELEFIHPFMDGNGRMGRFWQTLILMKQYPIFEFIPFENLIYKTQKKYYRALSVSDKKGSSTAFIEYMLEIIDESLNELLNVKGVVMTSHDRLIYFKEIWDGSFNRKDYMLVFKEISTATASRDLKLGVELKYFKKKGDKTNTIYTLLKK